MMPSLSANQTDTTPDLFDAVPSSPVAKIPVIVQIALPIPLFSVFDYALPDHIAPDDLIIGCRIRVPFGRREMIGIYLGTVAHADVELSKVKTIEEVLDQQAILPPDILDLLAWASSYYHFPIGEVIAAALPTLLKQGRPIDILEHYWHLTEAAAREPLKRASKQLEAFDLLAMHGQYGAPESTLYMMGVSKQTLQQLQKKGIADCHLKPIDYTPQPMKLAELPLIANPEQQHAIHFIQQHVGTFKGILLDGLTGSGKTEVYLQAMQPILEAGNQVLVLVPEIGLTPQTLSRFRSRFQCDVVALHSNLTDVARLQAWQNAQTGKALIVIGTRSAIFTPMPRLSLIIIDEEHDLSFKQQDSFRYHARDVALKRGQTVKCPVVLGSATPSFESLHLLQQQKLQALELTQRAGAAELAKIQLIDLKKQPVTTASAKH